MLDQRVDSSETSFNGETDSDSDKTDSDSDKTAESTSSPRYKISLPWISHAVVF